MEHRHIFSAAEGGTRMEDYFEFYAPLGVLGRLAEWLFLKRHMTQFLKERNRIIKQAAESGEWQQYI